MAAPMTRRSEGGAISLMRPETMPTLEPRSLKKLAVLRVCWLYLRVDLSLE